MMMTTKPKRHEVVHLNGKPIDFRHPPKPTEMVMWTKRTTGGKKIIGSFRTIAHWNRLNNLAIKKFGVGIEVIQACFNTGVAASQGTHDFDATGDFYIPGVSWWDQQRFFRANGLGCWYRHPPLFGNHVHGFTLPVREGRTIGDDFAVHGFKVGEYIDGGYSTAGHLYTSSQLVDYYNKAFGLKDQHVPDSDKSWFPPDIEATIFDLNRYVKARAKRAA